MENADELLAMLPSPNDPDAALGTVVALRRLADRLETTAVDAALDQGWTWQQIAQSLGITRQAAHKKHRRSKSGKQAKP